jgi:sacsin
MSEEPAITSIPGPPPESDFGQEYSLLKALNKLVRDYALGVGLFKEFIQNADDAEATEIRFILDQTSQTSRIFHNPKLAQLVGPALLVWNNVLLRSACVAAKTAHRRDFVGLM